MAIVRVDVVLSAKLFTRDDVGSAVFSQHCAVIPLVPHWARAVGCEYLPLVRACSGVDTHGQLRAGLGLREKFVSSFVIVIAVIRTEHLGSLRFKVIVRFCTVARRGKSLDHVLTTIVGLLRPRHNLTCPKDEVLLCWVVRPPG